jgi:hypothetical protein
MAVVALDHWVTRHSSREPATHNEWRIVGPIAAALDEWFGPRIKSAIFEYSIVGRSYSPLLTLVIDDRMVVIGGFGAKQSEVRIYEKENGAKITHLLAVKPLESIAIAVQSCIDGLRARPKEAFVGTHEDYESVLKAMDSERGECSIL